MGRNLPAVDGSSRLSPHFRFGTLSPRIAIHAALAKLAEKGRVSRPDVLTWVDELIWREFFQQVLAAFPRVVEGPFRKVPVPPSREPGPERDRSVSGLVQRADRVSDRGRRHAATESDGMDAQPCPDDRRLIPDQRPSDRLAERRAVLHASSARCGRGREQRKLAMVCLDRHGCDAGLSDFQSCCSRARSSIRKGRISASMSPSSPRYLLTGFMSRI